MKLKDFTISNESIVWMLLVILLFGNLLSYKMGLKDGTMSEKIGWLEDQEMQRKGITP